MPHGIYNPYTVLSLGLSRTSQMPKSTQMVLYDALQMFEPPNPILSITHFSCFHLFSLSFGFYSKHITTCKG